MENRQKYKTAICQIVDHLQANIRVMFLSFLDTAEISMAFFNIGLLGLSLQSHIEIDDEFLMNEVLTGASAMKEVRQAVNDYDIELSIKQSIFWSIAEVISIMIMKMCKEVALS